MTTTVRLGDRENRAIAWSSFAAGALVVVAHEGVFELPFDDPVAGCSTDLSSGLVTTEPVDLARSLPRLPDGEVDTTAPTTSVRTLLPVVVEAVGDGTFHVCGAGGDAMTVGPAVATVLAACRRPASRSRVDALLEAAPGELTVDDLRRAGLLAQGAEGRGDLEQRVLRNQRAHRRLDRRLTRLTEPGTGDGRIPLHGVWVRSDMDEWMPLALGHLIAIARQDPDLDARFRAEVVIPDSVDGMGKIARASEPGVFLFSDYVWNVAGNLALSDAVKRADPDHLVVHGGPSVPGNPADRDRFLSDHPQVDVLVHGEGEVTVDEILRRVASARSTTDTPSAVVGREAIAGTPGTTVRTADGRVVGPPRERIADLSTLPSPFLTGVFDPLIDAGLRRIVLETNRGCPFRCSFCDWGSATNSRIRTFPLDRVLAEIEWIVEREAEFLIMADANFGMLPRDLEIVERIADRHQHRGWPAQFGASMAKNPNRRFGEIVDRLGTVGLQSGAGLSLQTYDEATLENVDRRNIPRERYDGMWETFRAADVPMGAEFMIGLPGCTRSTFRDDLQFAVDRELFFLVHRTQVLPNAPMNAPEYREEFELVTDDTGHLIGTSSYGPADLREMLTDYQAVYGADHLGALRVVLRFLRQRTGLREVELAVRLGETARADPTSMPCTRWFLTAVGRWGCPPAGWDRFLAEVRAWAVAELGVVEDTALDAVLAAQRMALPHRTIEYPVSAAVPHDVAAWFADSRTGKLDEGGWTVRANDLSSYGPGTVRADDPWSIRENLALLAKPHGTSGWELDSPFKRPGTDDKILVV